jgi:hypothetical protein
VIWADKKIRSGMDDGKQHNSRLANKARVSNAKKELRAQALKENLAKRKAQTHKRDALKEPELPE